MNRHLPVTLRITRDLCYDNASEVVDAISSSLMSHPRGIMLDMSKVDMIDSSGLRALLRSRKLCEQTNVDFGLLSVSTSVERVLAMSGFATVFGFPSIDHGVSQREVSDFICPESEAWNVVEYQSVSDPSMIAVLRSRVIEAATAAGAKSDAICDIQIAVGEALTNAYRHGSPEKGVSKIKLRCMTCANAVVVEIEDEGEPFDPNAVSDPDPGELRDHGMGIYLMRQAMDVVDFSTNCPGNRVRMIKWLDA
ncbi:MAG: ATP-binding protein [Armatimonadota bacterium]|nr:ATP-binding protein [bacterium]